MRGDRSHIAASIAPSKSQLNPEHELENCVSKFMQILEDMMGNI